MRPDPMDYDDLWGGDNFPGQRAACRVMHRPPDTTPTYIEIESRES